MVTETAGASRPGCRARFPSAPIVAALAERGLLVGPPGPMPEAFTAVTDDSRAVGPGTLFVAIRGSARDGHQYVDAAIRAGATAVVVEARATAGVPQLLVHDARAAAAAVAAAAWRYPAHQIGPLVGVTGTNGKSTTVAILRHLLDRPDARSASIGTIGVLIGSEGATVDGGAGLTTPGPIELQRVLRTLVDCGVRSLAIEASSHSLDQRRIEGLQLDAAVFTNLTRDHLDYHGTMEAYRAAKAKLSSYLRPAGARVVNADDPAWRDLPPGPREVRFSAAGCAADVRAIGVRFGPRGTDWELAVAGAPATHPVSLPLIGDFNVANALGAAAAAWALGQEPATIAKRLSAVPQVPGRLEVLHEEPTVLRDYAHTPDALERSLTAVRPFTRGRLIVVFGAGGDRDAGKRPMMGAVAERLADVVILTSDNPRTEDPERILDDIERGMTRRHERVEDRERAVSRAIALARREDLILLAGKGHETYQVRGTVHYPLDERAIVQAAFGAS